MSDGCSVADDELEENHFCFGSNMCLISCLRQPFVVFVPMCLNSCLCEHQADSASIRIPNSRTVSTGVNFNAHLISSSPGYIFSKSETYIVYQFFVVTFHHI